MNTQSFFSIPTKKEIDSGNRSRGVDNKETRKKITEIVEKKIKR